MHRLLNRGCVFWRYLQRTSGTLVLGTAAVMPTQPCRNCHGPPSPSEFKANWRKDANWSCMPRGTRSVACHYWAPSEGNAFACVKATTRCEGVSKSIDVCSGTVWKGEHERKEGAFKALAIEISECQIEYQGPKQMQQQQQQLNARALILESEVQADCDQRIDAWRNEPVVLKKARAYERLPKVCQLRLEVR